MPHQCTSCGHVFADGSKEMLSGCPDCGGTKFQFHPEGADIPDRPDPGAEPPDPPTPDDSVAGAVGNAAATVKDLVGRGSADSPPETTSATGDAADGPAGPNTGSGDVGGVALETEASAQPEESGRTDASTAERTPATELGMGDSAEIEAEPSSEDSAQASARTDVVSPDELPDTSADTTEESEIDSSRDHPTAPATEQPDAPATTGDSTSGDPTADDSTAPETAAVSSGSDPASPEGTVVDQPDDSDDRPDLSELRKELNEQFESIKVVEPGQYELNLMELYDREEYIIALEEDGKYSIQVPDRWQD